MVSKKIVFLGSKPIGHECLSYLVAHQESLGVEITGLLTRARPEFGGNSDLEQLAMQHGIPIIASPDDLPECDILYSVQYHTILSAAHIGRAAQVAVNLHMAPLPEYRGSNQFSFAIVDGKTEFGATLHVIDTRIDHGDILFQTRFPIPERCWVSELYDLTYQASLSLFKDTLPDIVVGRYTPVPQQQLLGTHGTSLHYRNEMAALKVIDLAWDKEKIDRHIRATSMPGFEPPYCYAGGIKVYFTPAGE